MKFLCNKIIPIGFEYSNREERIKEERKKERKK